MTETTAPERVEPPKWGGRTDQWLAWARTLDPSVPDDATRGELREQFGDQWRALQEKVDQVVLVPADHTAESVTFGYDGDEYVITRAPGYLADPVDAADLLEAAAAAGVLIKIREA